MPIKNTSNYRDQLVQTIKYLGQEIINRAESMVDKDVDMITEFSIHIDIQQPMDGLPVLNWTTSVLPKLVMEHIDDIAKGVATATVKTNSVEVECKDERSCVNCAYRYGHSKCGVRDDKNACKTCEAKKRLGKCPCADHQAEELCSHFEREDSICQEKKE